MYLGRRFPLRADTWKRSLCVHLLCGAAIAAAQIAVNTWTHLTFVADPERGHTYAGYLRSLMGFAFHRNLLIYWSMIAGQHAFRTYRELKAQEVRASELKTQLAEARLQALKMQLHPHFLFNTLNAISALTRQDPARADRVLNDLSELLRIALDDVASPKVPLAREIQFLELYLDIQRVRFGERLRFRLDVAPETLPAQVPNLVLQPIVENAVRYAVASRYRGGRVELSARRDGDRLEIRVEDDGPGLPAGPEVALRAGIGLSSTRERLERMYGENHRLTLESAEGRGLTVRIEVPFETAPAQEAPARSHERAA
jgi:sensor histidine kinase YesM